MASQPIVLVVDDDPAIGAVLSRHLGRKGWDTREAHSIKDALRLFSEARPTVVIADLGLPDGHGMDLVARIVADGCGVVVVSSDDSVDMPIRAMQLGASDFLVKPFSLRALERAVEQAVAKTRAFTRPPPTERPDDVLPAHVWRDRHAPRLVGDHPTLFEVFALIERVAPTDCTVLVTGESGTGKELVARAIHDTSPRRDRPFVAVNCAAIPENLVESELFGHARGAFTGAITSRVGRFAAADGGTIFLDEVGELPLAMQAKLLRVLQEREIVPVGESRPQDVDVRVVAATNRDLEKMVDEGKFREDLLYRLQVIPVELPPLRKRSTDVPVLVKHFAERAAGRTGHRPPDFDPRALELLSKYDWPGNVRQLENAIERMVLLRGEATVRVEDVPMKMLSRHTPPPAQPSSTEPVLPEEGIDLREAVERFEQALIRQALERSGWNKNRAAALLRMNRTTLVERLKKREIERPDAAAARDEEQ